MISRESGLRRGLRVGGFGVVAGLVDGERGRARRTAFALVSLAVGGGLALANTLELLRGRNHGNPLRVGRSRGVFALIEAQPSRGRCEY